MNPRTQELLAEAMKEENHYMVELWLDSGKFYDLKQFADTLQKEKISKYNLYAQMVWATVIFWIIVTVINAFNN
jgi:hypothetical protein